ncbi:MAG: HAD family hydrolase [Deltaproteobacteria bacterium]|nr:HAD family hydrolase [Deltaproteobacteria bacterium]
MSGALRPALLLDRDGVLNVEVEYLHEPAALVIIPGAAAAVAAVNQLGVPVVVVSNQAGIGRGLYGEEAYRAVQDRLGELLATAGARVDADYHCPHHPELGLGPYRVACACRKPRPGMLLEAARDLGLDLRRSVLVGDKLIDLEAGRAVGCTTVLVRTGYGAAEEARAVAAGAAAGPPWDAVRDSLADALPLLLARLRG